MSVSGKCEPSVISTHILQSAFLAEERRHQTEENWRRRTLPARIEVHAILSGHTAHNSPRQNAASLEAKRLIDHTEQQRKCCGGGLACAVAFATSAVFLLAREDDSLPIDVFNFLIPTAVLTLVLLSVTAAIVGKGYMRAKPYLLQFLFIVYMFLCPWVASFLLSPLLVSFGCHLFLPLHLFSNWSPPPPSDANSFWATNEMKTRNYHSHDVIANY